MLTSSSTAVPDSTTHASRPAHPAIARVIPAAVDARRPFSKKTTNARLETEEQTMPASTLLWFFVPPAVLLASAVVFYIRTRERS
jgi:hypothetical protein